jgi:hypothetical protein
MDMELNFGISFDDEVGEHRNDRAIHGHRHGNLVERDALEQDLHVLDGIDGDPCLADISDDARMVAVIAAMGGEVEGHRNALLAGRQRLAVEGVGFLRRRETGILADRPRTTGIHGGARAAYEGREARQAVQMRNSFQIVGRVERLDRNAFGRVPYQRVRIALDLLFGQSAPFLDAGVGFRIVHHNSLPTQIRGSVRRRQGLRPARRRHG